MKRMITSMVVGLLALGSLSAAVVVARAASAVPNAPASAADTAVSRPLPPNPQIDMEGHLRVSLEAASHRETRRVTEQEFIRMSRQRGTVILDARSRERFEDLHVKGAIHLSFPDIAIESLARTIPDKNTRILIYCNNNFLNAPGAFPSKLPSASLNLSTFIALYNYGYRNVYELGDLIDIREAKLEFESNRKPLKR